MWNTQRSQIEMNETQPCQKISFMCPLTDIFSSFCDVNIKTFCKEDYGILFSLCFQFQQPNRVWYQMIKKSSPSTNLKIMQVGQGLFGRNNNLSKNIPESRGFIGHIKAQGA